MTEETFRWVIAVGVGIAVLCILAMAIIMGALFGAISKLKNRVTDMSDRVEPIIDTVKTVAIENAPKVSAITSNAVTISENAKDISGVARDQAHRFAEVGRDLADRTKAQIARVDSVVDDTVEQVHHAGAAVKSAVNKPVREAAAVLAGVKAAVGSLVEGRRPTVDHLTQDEEMFI